MESSDKRVVRVAWGGQELTVEVPSWPVDERAFNRKGGPRYAELYHAYFRGEAPTVAARMGPVALAVLCGLLVEADWESRIVRPDRRALAEALGLSISSVRGHLKRLERLGVISRLPQAGGVGGRGRRVVYLIIRPTNGGQLNVSPDDTFTGAKRVTKQSKTCHETDQNVSPDDTFTGAYKEAGARINTLTNNTTNRGCRMKKTLSEEIEALANLFFERRKSRRATNRDADVEAAIATWLGDWEPAEIATAIKASDWADVIAGVKRALAARPTRAVKAARAEEARAALRPAARASDEDVARMRAGVGRIRAMLKGK